MQKKLIAFIITVFSLMPISAQTFSLENGGGSVFSCTLENGLSVFIKQDRSVAVTSIELAVRAGYSSQTAGDSGFAPLYVRLIRAGNPGITASCNADSATYSVTASPSQTEEALAELSRAVTDCSFSDALIQRTYETFRNEVVSYAKTATSLINAAIDSRVFSEQPWKQDSGVYPALFASYSAEEVRAQVLMLRDSLYVPANSAVFITTPLEVSQVAGMVRNQFSSWQGKSPARKDDGSLEAETRRKFVIADDAFSPELTQIVVQFTTLSRSQADCLSEAFNALSSPYERELLSEPLLALRSADYLAASSAWRSGSTRLILQALMEEPYSFAEGHTEEPGEDLSAAAQADCFVRAAKRAAHLTRRELAASQSAVQARYRSMMGSSVTAMQVLCDFWAHDSSFGTDGFYSRFMDMRTAQFSLSEKELALAADCEEPFVFVMVSGETYRRQKQQFDDGGWTLVTADNAAWYDRAAPQQSAAQKDAADRERLDENARTYFADETISDAQRLYAANAESFFTGTLANGIPITLKETPYSQTVAFSLAIQGGELSSPEGQKFLRTILVNAFANNIQAEINALRMQHAFYGQTDIKAWTEETVSYISIQCQKEDLRSVLTAASNAVIFGEISPVTADNLVYAQKGQWGTRTQSPAYQLRTNALKGLYRGSSYEKLFGTDGGILGNTAFNSVALAYTRLLDAALYSIVMAGDIDGQEALSAAEETFGLLKEQTVREPYPAVPEPSFTSGTVRIRLSHTFTTDMPAELASPDSPLLVPTTEFSDPVAALFPAPDSAGERQVLNALLYDIASRMQERLPQGTTCTATGATAQVRAASIEVDRILHTGEFDRAYQSARASLITELSQQGGNLPLTRKILSDWIVRELSATQTNEGTANLIQEGIRAGNPLQYLADFLFLETLEAQDLLFYAEQMLPENPFTAYSADSKK